MPRTPLFHWLGRMVRAAMADPMKQSVPRKNGLKTETDDSWHTAITRREFLKTTLGTAGTIAALSMIDSPAQQLDNLLPRPATPVNSSEPVVIVGGGLGGLVTAYRLHQRGIRCELYEASYRLGGRVFTRRNFNNNGMFVELGGELVDTGHNDLIALCQELNVPLERFLPEAPGVEPAIFYSQGQVYTEMQVLEAFMPLAEALAQDLKKCFPDGELQLPTYDQPYDAAWLDQRSLADYLDEKRSVAPEWLIRLIGTAYVGEYGLDLHEQSALNLLMLIGTETGEGFKLFGESDEAMRIQGGNSSLVEALTQAVKPHVPIHYGHRLTRLALANATTQAQTDGPPTRLRLGLSVGKQLRWVNASQVVLALPFSLLRDVSGLGTLGLTPLKLQCIHEWGYGTNSKQMMGFKSKFWRNEPTPERLSPVCSGELFTDLPSQCYWETSRLQPGEAGILTNFLGGQAGREATESQWQNAMQELNPLMGELGSEFDGNRAFFNWHRYPWTKGSYTCPRPGQYTTLMGVAQLPELDHRLFFAGEHCSLNSAGYMNGAVESGNTAARQILENFGQAALPHQSREVVATL